jgi:DNA polymerase type B, organellar and viral
MQVKLVNMNRTEAERLREYRKRKGSVYRTHNAVRMRKSRANAIPEFIGVDSEGIGKGRNHRAVLLGVGAEQYVASNLRRGLQWEEVFDFLYAQYRQYPRATFVGFYLGYDFNQWLRSLPIKAARSLLTKEGRAARHVIGKATRRAYQSVKVGRWEVDMMGDKRLSIRPRPDGCMCYEQGIKCTHKQLPWMHICDAGPFYQMSFLSVLDPKRWKNDPDGWPVTQQEYDAILEGKNRRSTARLDEKMKYYNRLENEILARVMRRLAKGFASIGIRPAKDQWYGPGATASQWLRQHDAPSHRQLRLKDGKTKPLMPKWFWLACRNSYFGGWFEIFSHGLIEGTSYNYDINNAYPYAATKLPHICDECGYTHGYGDYNGDGEYVLLYATVFTNGDRIGAVPYRDKTGSILRPSVSKGWYWRAEIDAANRAGLVKKVIEHEWAEFVPCNHSMPFTDIERLYYLRLEVGKDGAQGMAIKLNNNSIYGKFAQSVGSAPFNNWFYASFITSHCRIQILDAIAAHPGGIDSVLMVATDGICFDSPNPNLPVSTKLGEWALSEYNELCLFKPGVYWHREGKEALLKVKSRGVPKEEFASAIEIVEAQFALVHQEGMFPGRLIKEYVLEDDIAYIRTELGWPYFHVPVNFRMKTCKQALNEGNWNTAGTVQEKVMLRQDSDPQSKRRRPRYNLEKRRIDTIIHDVPIKEIQTKYHGEVRIMGIDLGIGFDGSPRSGLIEAAGILRDKHANYDLPLDNDVEWINVW